MVRVTLLVLLTSCLWSIPGLTQSPEHTLLVLTGGPGRQSELEKRFSSELEMVAENARVVTIVDESGSFSTLPDTQKLDVANAKLQELGGLSLVWIEGDRASVKKIGLLVSAEGGTLARIVAFENPIAFMPELSVIVSELVEHALAYESEERAGRSDSKAGGSAKQGSVQPGDEVATSGLGSRIPAPDGWTRLKSENGAASAIEPAGDGDAPDEKNTPDGDSPSDAPEGTDAADKAGEEPTLSEKTDKGIDGNKPVRRRVALEPLFSLVQGIGPHDGSSLWLGGGGGVWVWPTPRLFVKIALTAQGGPLPRYNQNDLIGWRLIPAVSAGFLFNILNVGLGPMLEAAGMFTKITLDEAGYVPVDYQWGGFRVSLGGCFVAPTKGRISFTMSALFGVWATKGRTFVRGDDQSKIFTSALGEFSGEVGILIFL